MQSNFNSSEGLLKGSSSSKGLVILMMSYIMQFAVKSQMIKHLGFSSEDEVNDFNSCLYDSP